MASHSRSSKNREMPTYDLENLDYGERNNTPKRHIINKHKAAWEAGTVEAGGPIQPQIFVSTGTSIETFLYNKKK